MGGVFGICDSVSLVFVMLCFMDAGSDLRFVRQPKKGGHPSLKIRPARESVHRMLDFWDTF